MANLLESYYHHFGVSVIVVPPWHELEKLIHPIRRLTEIADAQGCRLDPLKFRGWDVVVIFDDAQISYHDKHLWLTS